MKKIKRICTVFFSALLIISIIGQNVVFAEIDIATPSNANLSKEASPAEASPAEASPAEASPAEASPAEASPAEASPAEADPTKFKIKKIKPDEVPIWYTQINPKKEYTYTFVDRYDTVQFRTYGYLEDESWPTWYSCDQNGEVGFDNISIDVLEEDMTLAPYRYRSEAVSNIEKAELSKILFDNENTINEYDFEVIDPDMGRNYDGTNYDIWWISEDLNNWTIEAKYYFYGYIENKENKENKWYQCNENGEIIEFLHINKNAKKTSISMNIEVSAYEENSVTLHMTGTYFDLNESSDSGGNRLYLKLLFNDAVIGPNGDWGEILTSHQYEQVGQSGTGHPTDIDYQDIGFSNPTVRDTLTIMNKNFDGSNDAFLTSYLWNGTQGSGWNSTWSYRKKYKTADSMQFWGNFTATNCDMYVKITNPSVYLTGAVMVKTYDEYNDYDSEYVASGISSIDATKLHKHTTITSYTAPTCTNTGYQSGTCTMCRTADFSESIPALGHITPDAYTQNGGYLNKYCSRGCGTLLLRNPITYGIKYNANGGSGTMQNSTHTYDSAKNLTANNFTRPGYTFTGWNTNSAGTGTKFSNAQNVINLTTTNNGVVNVYAQWELNNYTVNFNGNGGKSSSVTTGYNNSITLPDSERLGYTFLGWFTEIEHGTKIPENIKMPLNGATYYAHWTPNKYNINFKIEYEVEGKLKSKTLIKNSVVYDAAIGSLDVFDKEAESVIGYSFLGWYNDENKKVNEQWIFNPLNTTEEKLAEGYLLTAKFKVNNYKIDFYANNKHRGDSSVHESWDRSYNTQLGVLPEIKIPGFDFEGWHIATDSNAEEIKENTWVEPNDVNYYAHWNPKNYEITFDNNHYEITDKNIKKIVTYDEKIGQLPASKVTGYTFLGWFTGPTKGEQIFSNDLSALGNKTYYAHWSQNKYILTFNMMESVSEMKFKNIDYDERFGDLPVPVLEDFKFSGWYKEKYHDLVQEKGYVDYSLPDISKKIDEEEINRIDSDFEVYAYFTVVFQDIGNNLNRRPGKDGIIGTEDDNFYYNHLDGIPGSSDDKNVTNGYWVDDNGKNIYPGKDGIYGTEDDYRDNEDGTTTYPGKDCIFDTADDIIAQNGLDGTSGTEDDYINIGKNENLRPGEDGIFGTEDDERWWNGNDAIPGTEDDKKIEKGEVSDYVDLNDNSHLRPGRDQIFGTDDDEHWYNGADEIPATKDDFQIWPGHDGTWGTSDDYYYPDKWTQVEAGRDGIFGTDDDIINYLNRDSDKNVIPLPWPWEIFPDDDSTKENTEDTNIIETIKKVFSKTKKENVKKIKSSDDSSDNNVIEVATPVNATITDPPIKTDVQNRGPLKESASNKFDKYLLFFAGGIVGLSLLLFFMIFFWKTRDDNEEDDEEDEYEENEGEEQKNDEDLEKIMSSAQSEEEPIFVAKEEDIEEDIHSNEIVYIKDYQKMESEKNVKFLPQLYALIVQNVMEHVEENNLLIKYKNNCQNAKHFYKVTQQDFDNILSQLIKPEDFESFFEYCTSLGILKKEDKKITFADLQDGKSVKVYLIRKRTYDYMVGEMLAN